MTENYFCARTYHEVTFYQDGFYRPCTEMFPVHSGLHIKSHSLDEFRGSSWLRELQNDLETGNLRTECRDCISREQEGYGWRLSGNIDLADRPLGGIKNLMIWLGNLCNADCSMCNPTFSSKIDARLRQNPLPNFDTRNDAWLKPNQADQSGGQSFWWRDGQAKSRLIQMIEIADRIKILGGEPMLMPGVWEILDIVYQVDPKKTVSITTNASILTEANQESLIRFNNLQVNISVDAIGNTFEWIRHGLKWKTVQSNIPKIMHLSNKIEINATLSAHNIMALEESIDYFESNGLTYGFWNVTRPYVVNIRNLPRDILLSRQETIKSMIKNSHVIKKKKTLMQLSLAITRALHEQATDQATDALIKYTEYLNSFRSKKFCTETWKVID